MRYRRGDFPRGMFCGLQDGDIFERWKEMQLQGCTCYVCMATEWRIRFGGERWMVVDVR